MNNEALERLKREIGEEVDKMLFNCFIDLPQMFGHSINENHDLILQLILEHINTHEKRYLTEEEE
jgi:hypothetical protein